MKYLTERVWSSLSFPDFRARFFIETFWELLSRNTPHFHQARLMNVFSCATETLEALKEYEEDEKNRSSLCNSVEEFQKCWEKDHIAAEIFSEFKGAIERVLGSISVDKLTTTKTERIKYICKYFVSNESTYHEVLIGRLKHLIISQVELSQKDRITKQIYNISNLYVTFLLNKGYSPTYLYNRMEYLTRATNYKGRSFQAQFQSVIDGINDKERLYKTCFPIQTSDKRPFLKHGNVFDVSFSEAPPSGITVTELSSANRRANIELYATIEIIATDYIGAAWKGKETLGKAFDFVLYGHSNVRAEALNACISSSKIGGITHKWPVNISLLIDFLTSNTRPLSESSHPFGFDSNLINKISEDGIENISRSLRYLRLGKETPSLEKKFLNIWISLESLFGKNEKSIIGNLTEFVPLIYAVKSIKTRVDYTLYLLKKNKISIPAAVVDRFNLQADIFNDNISSNILFNILKEEKMAIEVFNACGEKEHLKFRYFHTFNEVKSPSAILSRIEKTVADVQRQLKRIYLVRNKIAHRGHYGSIRPQLVNHLFDYTTISYEAILVSLGTSGSRDKLNLQEALLAYKLGADDIFQKLKDKPPTMELNELIVRPVA